MEMTRERKLALVKEIIKDGYDKLDVISFELDIPMDELIKLKKQIEQEKESKSRILSTNQNISKRSQSLSRMRTIAQKI